MHFSHRCQEEFRSSCLSSSRLELDTLLILDQVEYRVLKLLASIESIISTLSGLHPCHEVLEPEEAVILLPDVGLLAQPLHLHPVEELPAPASHGPRSHHGAQGGQGAIRRPETVAVHLLLGQHQGDAVRGVVDRPGSLEKGHCHFSLLLNWHSFPHQGHY